MPSFGKLPIGMRLETALDTQDNAEVGEVRRELIRMYGEDGIGIADMEAAVAMARDARSWETVVELSESIIARDQVGSPRILRIYSQALIELGALSGAECVLKRLLDGDPGDQEAEANGLLGRVAKQRYVNFNRKQQLRAAIDAYHKASEDPDKTAWAYSNLLGLLNRADQDDVTLGRGTPRLADIRDELDTLVRKVDPQARNVWERAMDIELLLLDGREDEAATEARTLADANAATAFELNSLNRQLAEVWRLSEDNPLRLALNNSSLSMGAGAVAEVPAAEVLEKILGKERAVSADTYQLGIHAGRQVCMITDRYDNPLGTGFALPGNALADHLGDAPVVVTNAHVIADQNQAKLSRAKFTRLFDKTHDTLVVDELDLIWSSPIDELDVVVLAVEAPELQGLGGISVSAVKPDPTEDDPYVYIIGHPGGRALELSIRGNKLLEVSDTKLHYEAPTEEGSSGSPVFDKAWNLVGVHRAGSFSMVSLTDPTDRYPANQAIYIRAIGEALSAQA